MPGTGRKTFFDNWKDLPITVRSFGGLGREFVASCSSKLDTSRPSHRYLLRQCQYIMEEISLDEVEALQGHPMHSHRQFGNLKVRDNSSFTR